LDFEPINAANFEFANSISKRTKNNAFFTATIPQSVL
jgi:hypothetical protein